MSSKYTTTTSLGSLGIPPASSQINIHPVRYKSQRVRAQVHEPDEDFDTLRRKRRGCKTSSSSSTARTTNNADLDGTTTSYSTNSLGRTRPKQPLGGDSSDMDQAWNRLIERRKEYKSRYQNLKNELDEATARLEGRDSTTAAAESSSSIRRTASFNTEPTRTRSNELKEIADNVDKLMAKTKKDMTSLRSGTARLGVAGSMPMSSATLTATMLSRQQRNSSCTTTTNGYHHSRVSPIAESRFSSERTTTTTTTTTTTPGGDSPYTSRYATSRDKSPAAVTAGSRYSPYSSSRYDSTSSSATKYIKVWGRLQTIHVCHKMWRCKNIFIDNPAGVSLLSDAWQRRSLERWWVSELLVSAYNTTHQQHSLVKPCASAQKSCLTVVGC